MGRLFFLGAIFIISSIASAGIKCSELEPIWREKYVKDFKIKWNAEKFDCPGKEGKFALALYDLQTTEYKLNSSNFKPDFYKYVLDRVIRFHRSDACDKGLVAHSDDDDVTLCTDFFTDTREDRASTIVHETRHHDKDDPGHVTCAGGVYAGIQEACDKDFYDGALKGSGFNADIYYLGWTLNNRVKNDLSDAILQSDINAMVPDRFNHITGTETRKWRR